MAASTGRPDEARRRKEECPVRQDRRGHRRLLLDAPKQRQMMSDGIQGDVPGSKPSASNADRLDDGTSRLSRKTPSSSSANTNTNNCSQRYQRYRTGTSMSSVQDHQRQNDQESGEYGLSWNGNSIRTLRRPSAVAVHAQSTKAAVWAR